VAPLVVVGLGNPGAEYEGTRHNVGFQVIDELARRVKSRLKRGDGDYLFSLCRMDGRNLVLVKPLTYMNNSGQAALGVLERFAAPIENLMVIADDFALPLGVIRVKPKGSDGGHNGLYSIIYTLGSNEFPRIRCGIQQEAMPGKNEKADFVLSAFEPGEIEAVNAMVVRAADAALEFGRTGIARTMNLYNG
jgi:peptidyl-tRNA hydrolase, PTH1 family